MKKKVDIAEHVIRLAEKDVECITTGHLAEAKGQRSVSDKVLKVYNLIYILMNDKEKIVMKDMPSLVKGLFVKL